MAAWFDKRTLYHFDWPLLAGVLALTALGIMTLLSAAYAGRQGWVEPVVVRQLLWAALGTVLLLGAALSDYRKLAAAAYPFYGLALALLAAVAVGGREMGGSRRWLSLGVFRLEPSELMKLALVVVLARYFSREPPAGGWRGRHLLVPALLIAPAAALVMKQPDLGTALVLLMAGATVIFGGGLRLRTGLGIVLSVALSMPLAWHELKPYQRARLESFVNPQADPLRSGYHLIQSEIAIGAGGALGKGFLKGTQARLNFLPERRTDFIFSVFAEEFGFFGATLLLAVYAAMVWRGLAVARRARERFGALLALGFTSIILWQVVINVGMASGLLPVVGIPLPFVSYGGTSLVAMMFGVGLIISVNIRRYLF
ncbi:MAG: rod shape-determining protein RodA [Deltaproteobacteria bacterium]|nr:rod shape-determining protein RodA [Deltaproteobacteria bacterium]